MFYLNARHILVVFSNPILARRLACSMFHQKNVLFWVCQNMVDETLGIGNINPRVYPLVKSAIVCLRVCLASALKKCESLNFKPFPVPFQHRPCFLVLLIEERKLVTNFKEELYELVRFCFRLYFLKHRSCPVV